MTRPIAVAATAAFGADVLERLAERHEIRSLITRPDAPAGRGRKLARSPAKDTALRLGIPVLEPDSLQLGLDVDAPTVVAVAYGLIVPDDVLAERLWLNVHPSLLPRWRGAAPVERALMAGDSETGVTIIKLVKELDAGPIAAQRSFAVAPEDDAGAVYARAAELAVDLLNDVLAEPSPVFREQGGEATYAPQDHERRPSARPGATRRPSSSTVSAHSRRTSELAPSSTAAASRSGVPGLPATASFEPVEVQPDGGRRMTYDAWRRGLRP